MKKLEIAKSHLIHYTDWLYVHKLNEQLSRIKVFGQVT